jgi:hypothetical protein
MMLRILRRFLIFVGCVQSLALIAVFLPREIMEQTSISLEAGSLGTTPLPAYLARLSSVLYFIHGLTLIMVAVHLPSSLGMVKWLSATTMLLGFMMFLIDFSEGMPIWWSIGEGSILLLCSAIYIVLYRLSNLEAGAATVSTDERVRF